MQKFNDREEEEENEELEDIEQIWDDKFKLSRPVAAAFCRFIIGKKGETKRRLESETHSVITVPKQGVEGNVVITGSTRADVASCWRRIRLLIDSGRRKLAPTHFVSIPMTSRAIRAKFTEFKEKILAECPHSLGLDSSIFQEAEKLHITVGMLTLMNEAERNEAIQALIACGEEVVKPELKNEKWTLSMKGIEVMNDDAMAVDILFGRVSLKNDQSGVR